MIMAKQKAKKKGLSPNAKWGIAFLVEIFIAAVMGIGYLFFYANAKLNKIVKVELKEEELAINEGSNEAQKGYTTIALFGIDARSTDSMMEGNRSDAIIIASINNETKEVRMASVYRDTLLAVSGNGTTKATHAYAYGGPELAVQMLNENLDLQITDFATVNFLALTKAIDDLGGITINVKEEELEMLNLCITEQIGVTGIYSDGVFSAGEQLLNGTQATAWARIRSTDQGDITRTERQRTVISKIIAKAKHAGLSTINEVIDDVFPCICTSLDKDEIIDLAKGMLDYNMGPTVGFPMELEMVGHETKGSIIVAADLFSNVQALHQFLFGTEAYTPTQTVQGISNDITAETGIGARPININEFIPPSDN